MLLSPPLQLAVQPSAQHTALLHRLTRGHVLAIDPDSLGGLLLVKAFYVDFAGPGAAVGGEFDQDCTAVYAICPSWFRQNLLPVWLGCSLTPFA
jgi:hypothetical protein